MNDGLILDTHIWVWLMSGSPSEFSSRVLTKIQNTAKEGKLFVPAISVWEVAMLEAKRKLTFSVSCQDWIDQALQAPGIQLAPLSPQIAVESSRLPGELHGDPSDRIIVATARKLGLPLLTADKKILSYAQRGYVNAIAPKSE